MHGAAVVMQMVVTAGRLALKPLSLFCYRPKQSAFCCLLVSLLGGGVLWHLCPVQHVWPMLNRSGCYDLPEPQQSGLHASFCGSEGDTQ